jgi:hypothetical protein
LRPLALTRGRQRGDPADTRVEALGDALDRAAFARGIPALEQDDDLFLFVLNPVLQFDEFAL